MFKENKEKRVLAIVVVVVTVKNIVYILITLQKFNLYSLPYNCHSQPQSFIQQAAAPSVS